MKRITGVVILVFLSIVLNAQQNQEFLFINTGISGGNLSGGQVGINCVFNHKISIQLEYSNVMRKAKNRPDDYSGGLISLFSFGSLSPIDEINSFRIMPGFVSFGKTSGKFTSNSKAGISFLSIKEPINWVKDPAGGLLLVPNYTWEIKTTRNIGFIIKSDFIITSGKYLGFSASPYLEISKITTAGIAFEILLGKTGDWKTVKKK